MRTIRVEAGKGYDVLIGRGLLAEAGRLIAEHIGKCRVAVISDDVVFELYGEALCGALSGHGLETVSFAFPHGEQQKTLETYGNIVNFLCGNRLTRTDAVIALGGGVAGDMAGFAAATYQRGIRLVQIPTTLLAMVDSSVGGKTAVDLPEGKNQVGCFYQPDLVICDPDTLSTLPKEEYLCGCAEVIKYAVLGSAELFERLEARHISEQEEQVIADCVAMKSEIVEEDEFDTGRRRLLNLGHTFGHAVEKCSGYGTLHGQAVAAGTAIMARAALAKGYCGKEACSRIVSLLERYGLPVSTEFTADELSDAARNDKKLTGTVMHLIVPEDIGRCRIEAVPAGELRQWLVAGGIR